MMLRRFLMTAVALSAICVHGSALAQQELNILSLQDGQTIINLSTTERVEVDQDLLVATLRFEAENKDSGILQNEINTAIKKAVDLAKAQSDIKLKTQQYYVYPHDPVIITETKEGEKKRETKERIWRGSQQIEIKSTNADAVLKLTGEIQSLGLVMTGLGYTLSPEKAEETRDNLMEGALAKLKQKAERAAKSLDKTKVNLLEVNVDANAYYPQPMMAMAAEDSMGLRSKVSAAPVAVAGQTELNMTVSAKALITP
jgi:predicted secreted protein